MSGKSHLKHDTSLYLYKELEAKTTNNKIGYFWKKKILSAFLLVKID